jgi:hypothetical protein
VTLHDGAPLPVIIDFGIAKATEQRLTDKTLHRLRAVHRNSRLHESRTGRDESFGYRHAQRHLFVGGSPL